MNRVNREADKIAKDFDVLAKAQIVHLDEIYSLVGAILVRGKNGAENDKDGVRIELATLLSNVLKSYTAAFALLRSGWRLQPFLCIRNSYEGLALILHLFGNWEDLPQYKSGSLKSTTTFRSAKELIPHFGRLYGDLSTQFVHIGQPYGHAQKGNTYSEDEMDLWHCLGQLALLIWVTYQAAELVFYHYTEEKFFWSEAGEHPRPGHSQVGVGYKWNLTSDAAELKKRVFSFYQEKFSTFDE
jgi:hypothetical protein